MWTSQLLHIGPIIVGFFFFLLHGFTVAVIHVIPGQTWASNIGFMYVIYKQIGITGEVYCANTQPWDIKWNKMKCPSTLSDFQHSHMFFSLATQRVFFLFHNVFSIFARYVGSLKNWIYIACVCELGCCQIEVHDFTQAVMKNNITLFWSTLFFWSALDWCQKQ